MTSRRAIDLNADCGEGVGDDAALIPLVSSANLACGFHAGEPDILHVSVQLCRDHGVAVGAQPSLADREGFGRRELPVTPDQVYTLVLYQIGAVAAFCRASNVALRHVKPHGALYNMAARDASLAVAVAAAVHDFDPALILFGLADSALTRAGSEAGLQIANEAFIDRRYRADGSLAPRGTPGALIDEIDVAVAQALSIVQSRPIQTVDGELLVLEADTLCLHGDGPHAIDLARQVRSALNESGIVIRPPASVRP